MLIPFFTTKKWEKERILNNDSVYYWLYLPATWIYQDLQFSFPLDAKRDGHVWFKSTERRLHYSKMTSGASIVWAPFFAIGCLSSFHWKKI